MVSNSQAREKQGGFSPLLSCSDEARGCPPLFQRPLQTLRYKLLQFLDQLKSFRTNISVFYPAISHRQTQDEECKNLMVRLSGALPRNFCQGTYEGFQPFSKLMRLP